MQGSVTVFVHFRFIFEGVWFSGLHRLHERADILMNKIGFTKRTNQTISINQARESDMILQQH
jgi:hypothetical protein